MVQVTESSFIEDLSTFAARLLPDEFYGEIVIEYAKSGECDYIVPSHRIREREGAATPLKLTPVETLRAAGKEIDRFVKLKDLNTRGLTLIVKFAGKRPPSTEIHRR